MKQLIYIIAFLVIFAAYVKYIESRSIFFPTKVLDATPQILNIPFEDVFIETPDGIKVHGWFIPQEGAKYTILFLHGNGGNISHRLEKILLLRQSKVNLFIIDYRGYGKSSGRPSERGIYLDAQAAYDYLVGDRKISSQDIILYGESLGSTVAIDLASKVNTGGLILEGAFSSGKDMARILYPYLPTWLFFNRFNSFEKIKNINAPKLFIHSKSDEIVPFKLAQKLFDAAKEPKQFVEIRGGHNTAFIDSSEEYTLSIKSFIENIE